MWRAGRRCCRFAISARRRPGPSARTGWRITGSGRRTGGAGDGLRIRSGYHDPARHRPGWRLPVVDRAALSRRRRSVSRDRATELRPRHGRRARLHESLTDRARLAVVRARDSGRRGTRGRAGGSTGSAAAEADHGRRQRPASGSHHLGHPASDPHYRRRHPAARTGASSAAADGAAAVGSDPVPEPPVLHRTRAGQQRRAPAETRRSTRRPRARATRAANWRRRRSSSPERWPVRC